MIKTALIDKVAFSTKLTRKQTTIVINSFLSSITGTLSEGKDVEIKGFGSFRVRQRGSRVGLNPKTGSKVFIPAKKAAYFRPSKKLKTAVEKIDIDQISKNFKLRFWEFPCSSKEFSSWSKPKNW